MSLTPADPNPRQWTVHYALIAYGASWIIVAVASLGTHVLFGIHLGAAGALWFDLAWIASLIPLRRAGQLRAADLGLRTTPAARAFALTMLVFLVLTLFDAVWQIGLGIAPPVNPFAGIATKSTALIVLTGVAAVLSPVVEEVFFRGLLTAVFAVVSRCFGRAWQTARCSRSFMASTRSPYSPSWLSQESCCVCSTSTRGRCGQGSRSVSFSMWAASSRH